MSEAVALRMSGVKRTYRSGGGELPILRGADLELRAGEIVALVAPSGAGKSTFLHLAGLLEKPDGGQVFIGGRDAGALSDSERTAIRRDSIGFVYQFHHLLGEFSARENVVLPQLIRGTERRAAEARAELLLGAFGLASRVRHLPGKLSGGEQQRVAIARALANRAEADVGGRTDREPRLGDGGGGVRRVAGDGAASWGCGADRHAQHGTGGADGSHGDAARRACRGVGMYCVTGERKRDPVLRWNLPDRVFFACGACHILAYAFMERHGPAKLKAVWLKPAPGFTGNHVFVTADSWVFDYHGYSRLDRFLRHTRHKASRWWPGWSATLVELPQAVLVSEARSRTYDGLWLREPRQFLHDAMPRAEAYLDRFPPPSPASIGPVVMERSPSPR